MSGMYGEIALELIKELERHKGKLPPFQVTVTFLSGFGYPLISTVFFSLVF